MTARSGGATTRAGLVAGQPSPALTPRMGRDQLVATGRLMRLILRRDRLRLVLWAGGLVALMAVSAQSVASLYDDPATIAGYVRTVGDNPALVVFAGPGYGFDDPNTGVVLVNETALWLALGCGLMSVFLVNRHTRAEEDNERADLIRSTVVGRHAPVTAAVLVAVGANLVVAALSAAAIMGFGFDLVGTVALTLGIGLVGVTFAAATAVAVQVAGTSRAALGLAAGGVGVAFVVRGVGDVGAPVLSWLTPFGWGIGVRAFAGERWWTLAGLVVASAGLLVAAYSLSGRRDLGAGLLGQRPGPASAGPWTRRPLGLVLRLQRGAIVGWAVGLAVAGLVYGSVADDIESLVAENPEIADFLAQAGGASLTDTFLATSLRLLALLVSGFAVASALRMRSDEAAGHAEPMLAAALSRWWFAGSRLVVTVAAALALMVVCGAATGAGYATAVGDWSQVPSLALASLANAPAVLVLVGVATALFGWLPRATAAAWVALAVVVVVEVFATVLRLPQWLTLVSPLTHVPSVPAEDASALPLVVLTLIAVALTAAGLVGFRRRDLSAA